MERSVHCVHRGIPFELQEFAAATGRPMELPGLTKLHLEVVLVLLRMVCVAVHEVELAHLMA